MPKRGSWTFAGRWMVPLALTAFLCACASTGTPKPTEETKPPAINRALAVVQGTIVQAKLWIPKAQKTENQPERVRALRLVWQGEDDDRAKAKIDEIPSLVAPSPGLPVTFTDTVTPGTWVRYEIFNQNKNKVVGERFDLGRAKIDPSAATPENLRVEAGDGHARLTWGAGGFLPSKVEGGRSLPMPVVVYRIVGEVAPSPLFPLTDKPVEDTSYEDWTLDMNTETRYRVCHARMENGLIVQGGCASEVSITVTDKTPPPEPTILKLAQARDKGVLIRWQASADPGVLGYRVERKAGPKGAYGAVSEFLTVTEYTDRTLDDKPQTYYYRVVVMDRGGHESRSAEQAIDWPPKGAEPAAPEPATPESVPPEASPSEPMAQPSPAQP